MQYKYLVIFMSCWSCSDAGARGGVPWIQVDRQVMRSSARNYDRVRRLLYSSSTCADSVLKLHIQIHAAARRVVGKIGKKHVDSTVSAAI